PARARSTTESTSSIPSPQSWAELSAEHQRFHTRKRTSPRSGNVAMRESSSPRRAKAPPPRWAKVPRRAARKRASLPAARKRAHPAARKHPSPRAAKPPSLSVEPGLVDVPFGQPEAFGHLPGRILGPHTGIDQSADFAEVVLRGGLDLSGASEHKRQLPAQSCGGRL